MKTGLKIVLVIVIVLVAAIGFIGYYFYQDTQDPYVQACDYTVADEVIPKFKEASINFRHQFDDSKSLPMMAAALIDIDNDGVDELFVGGGNSQPDALFQYAKNSFTDIASKAFENEKGDDATLGAAAADMNNDGTTDLVVCRTSGVYLYLNNDSSFKPIKLSIPLNEKSTPVSVSLGDINKDGWLDMFIAAYIKLEKMEGQTIFNDPNYGATSLMMLNNGDNSFTDITHSSELHYIHNTFQGILIDADDDGWLDLVVAHDTGEVRTYKNVDGKNFEKKENPISGKFAYPMGIAAGDYNNDGLVDFFFSNTGSSVPEFMARGDLRDDQVFIKDWILFRNEGNFIFTDAASEAKLANFEFSWGAIFEDFNLDGKQDLAVAENYIDFPPQKAFKLPCRLLIQQDGERFAAVEEQAGAINKNYAITPLSTDFNSDGYPALIYSNLDGPLKIFMSEGGTNYFLKVSFQKNAKNLGATVRVSHQKKILTDFLYSGEGLCSDQSGTLIFGLAKDSVDISQVVIQYISGQSDTLRNVRVDSTVKIK